MKKILTLAMAVVLIFTMCMPTLANAPGSMDMPYELTEGVNEITVDAAVVEANEGLYCMTFTPSTSGTYTITAKNADEAATEIGFVLLLDEGNTELADDDMDGIILTSVEVEAGVATAIWCGFTGDAVNVSLSVEAPAAGSSADNPIYVPMPGVITENPMVEIPANSTVYYAFVARAFNGWTLIVDGADAVTIGGVAVEPNMFGAFQGVMQAMGPAMMAPDIQVAISNTTEETKFSYLTLQAPIGMDKDSAFELAENATTEVVVDGSIVPYYSVYMPTANGDVAIEIVGDSADYAVDFLLNANDYDDSNDVTESLTPDADGKVVYEASVNSYEPIYVLVLCRSLTANVTCTLTEAPAGSERNPIQVYDSAELENVTVAAGASVYYSLGWGFNGQNVKITCDEGVYVIYNGTRYDAVDGVIELSTVMNENWQMFLTVVNEGTAEGSLSAEIVYPLGDYNNPEEIVDGEVTVTTEEGDSDGTYYLTYTALNDGVLTVTPDSIDTISDIMLQNETLAQKDELADEDWDNLNNWMSDNGTYDDNGNPVFEEGKAFVSIPVSKGDEITVQVMAKQPLMWGDPTPAMNVTLTVEGPEAPVGHPTNPGVTVDGDNALSVPAGSDEEGYFTLYTATADGKLTVTFGTLDKLAGIAISDYEMDNAIAQTGSEITDGVLTMDVKEGEQYWIALLPASADAFETTVKVDLEVPVVDDDKDDDKTEDDKKEDDKTEDKPASPVTGPITGAGIALVVAAASGAYVFLNKKR